MYIASSMTKVAANIAAEKSEHEPHKSVDKS
jgi:hypothetical protein